MSKRSDKLFIAIYDLASKKFTTSILFGRKKEVFTGTSTKWKGYWEEDNSGTLSLDEIDNLLPEVRQMMLMHWKANATDS